MRVGVGVGGGWENRTEVDEMKGNFGLKVKSMQKHRDRWIPMDSRLA